MAKKNDNYTSNLEDAYRHQYCNQLRSHGVEVREIQVAANKKEKNTEITVTCVSDSVMQRKVFSKDTFTVCVPHDTDPNDHLLGFPSKEE